MARIKIKDLPKNMKVSKEEMRKVMGGLAYALTSSRTAYSASVPTLAIRYPSTFTAFNWGTPQYESPPPCPCIGMPQDPKTQILPG